jgi:hypothetical protein
VQRALLALLTKLLPIVGCRVTAMLPAEILILRQPVSVPGWKSASRVQTSHLGRIAVLKRHGSRRFQVASFVPTETDRDAE